MKLTKDIIEFSKKNQHVIYFHYKTHIFYMEEAQLFALYTMLKN